MVRKFEIASILKCLCIPGRFDVSKEDVGELEWVLVVGRAGAPAGFHWMTALSNIDTWSSVQGEAMLTVDARVSAAGVGVPAGCGVSTSIASSLLAGVAVVDVRPFFFGPIVFDSLVAKPIEGHWQVDKVLL